MELAPKGGREQLSTKTRRRTETKQRWASEENQAGLQQHHRDPYFPIMCQRESGEHRLVVVVIRPCYVPKSIKEGRISPYFGSTNVWVSVKPSGHFKIIGSYARKPPYWYKHAVMLSTKKGATCPKCGEHWDKLVPEEEPDGEESKAAR